MRPFNTLTQFNLTASPDVQLLIVHMVELYKGSFIWESGESGG